MKPEQTQKEKSVIWEEQFKIRPRRNASIKHEHIKLQLVLSLLEKYKRNLYWIRIYTEFKVDEGKITDVYFENVKSKEIICYEIQKNISTNWLNKTKKFYDNLDKLFFKTDWILIKENELSDDINILNKQIKELIV